MRSERLPQGIVAVVLALAVGILAGPRSASALKDGDAFPHFQGKDLMTDAPVDTKAALAKNKVLLIDFWAQNCSACLEEMPFIADIFNRYKDKGFMAVGVQMDRGADRAKKFISKDLKFKLTYPSVLDPQSEIMRKLSVSTLPTNILVDATGTVRLFHIGYKAGFEKELEEIIKKHLQ